MENHRKSPADSARQRQIQRIVADVIALLPLLRAGQPNPQFDGKSWRQWSADHLRDRAAAFCPRQPHHQTPHAMPPRPGTGALYEPTPPWHRGPGGAVYRGD
ncbi:hypothetical protein QMU90_003427 [Edwardsiella ictaluri]|uniref:Uncharacterized protein n=1 Tax=Edwardsiella ictaluri TaxID=67780 RepID=A0ABY8GFR3_EDWIC|nr:hypothetical protein [Edwardsiella ictaluri]ELV7529477.1 hypothetical protein [Edwardsiella ictaluri]KOO54030.1 hypothetical protein ACS33_16535 [Edwardsiella ictaluri]WFN96153.1 hypothetical protein MAY91_15390 [Edwardsiella ictaluri]